MSAQSGQQGNIFIASLGLLMMMVFLGTSLFYSVEKEFKVEEAGHQRVAAVDAAETGLQMGVFWLEDVAEHGLYPEAGELPVVTVPSLASGDSITLAKGSGCHGYSRFNQLNLAAGDTLANNPSADLSTPVSAGLRLLSSAPTAIAGCTLLSIDADSPLAGAARLSKSNFDFYVEPLPPQTAEAVGQQVGVSTVYGHSGQNVSYPYRIRAVGRYHPESGIDFDATDATESLFHTQVVLDLWVHYEV